MSRRALVAVSAALGLALVATACGSTEDTTQTAQTSLGSDQICGKTDNSKPGYANGVAAVSGGAKTVSGAGSTFVAPMMSVWSKAYSESDKVQVAYQSIGSGAGVKQISAGTVDFGASDTPMKDSELAAAKGGEILHIPLILGGVVPTYNVKGLKAGLKFDGPTLGKIFTGQITSWDDAALKALNPDVQLPSEPIAIAHRSDGSGTTAVWTDYLTKESPDWVEKLGAGQSQGKEVAWPVGIGGKGNEGVSGVVGKTEGAIGYVELTYALQQNLTYGLVKNKAGKFIQPCVDTIIAGAVGAKTPADLRTSFTDGSDPNAYPITGTSYALVYAKQTDKAKAAALVNFLSWVLTTGQNSATSVDFAPLQKDLQQKSMDQVKKITFNGAPLGS